MTAQPAMLLADEKISRSIIGAFYDVYNALGYGFVERVYLAALAHELRKRGHRVRCELKIPIFYDGQLIAYQRIDMLVDDTVIVETKVSDHLAPAWERQLYNYLCAAGREVGLLLYFTYKPKVRRIYRARKVQSGSS
jgi:GxxExxY protein